ncbi:hypothetical protein CsSME_00049236 [Camellia sinensis var. sinensis]
MSPRYTNCALQSSVALSQLFSPYSCLFKVLPHSHAYTSQQPW